jgi:hypothetical protein
MTAFGAASILGQRVDVLFLVMTIITGVVALAIAGCHSQLLRAELPREAGCVTGAIHNAVVYADTGRHISFVLRGILRHRSRAHARRHRRDAAA